MQNYDLAKNQAVEEEQQRAQHPAVLGAAHIADQSYIRMQCFEAILRAKPHLPAEEIAKDAQIMLTFVQGGEK